MKAGRKKVRIGEEENMMKEEGQKRNEESGR
jgi:hypothetical protein